jgi:hypothetical protein
LFIVERGGIVKVLQPGQAAPTVFLDITTPVLAGGEQGLLGLAFHPQYPSNRRFFVNYTRKPDGATVIAEYLVSATDPNAADPLSERVFLVIPQPFANHNGGMVEFGPDGRLYIGMGDGGAGNDPGNRAQNVTDLLGKILRIDVDVPNPPQLYSSPSTNPFFGPGGGADEIFALGMRNPWRFSFDRATGQLHVGDVGQGAFEEIDIVVSGGNYGWRIWEASQCTGLDPTLCGPAGFVFPIAAYAHTGGRCSVTGGYVYRGALASLPLGGYVYGDFCTGELFLHHAGASAPILGTGVNISSFGESESGEIYLVGLGGTVHRIASLVTPRDADGDGRADLVWRHTGGEVDVWRMNGPSVIGTGSPGAASSGWTIVGVGDIDGDGKTDLLWRHTSGLVGAWLLDGTRMLDSDVFASAPAGWSVARVGDVNGDGNADMIWRHSSGTVAVWLLDGFTILGTATLGAAGTDWTIAGLGDVNGDGNADLLWRHTSGEVAVWLLDGTSVAGTAVLGPITTDWTIVGVGDINGDGKADLLWRQASGAVTAWLLDGASVVGTRALANAEPGWTVVGMADVNGDGKADVLWRHTSGDAAIWLLDGVGLAGSVVFAPPSPTGWTLQ